MPCQGAPCMRHFSTPSAASNAWDATAEARVSEARVLTCTVQTTPALCQTALSGLLPGLATSQQWSLPSRIRLACLTAAPVPIARATALVSLLDRMPPQQIISVLSPAVQGCIQTLLSVAWLGWYQGGGGGGYNRS